LLSLLDVTRAEQGCVVFDLHQDKENPAHFFFYEVWETKELWEAHMNTAYFTAYKEKTADTFAEISFNVMTKIDMETSC
jgi:quinol monooxygenase YgiN